MIRRAPRLALLQFLLLSCALHLFFLLGFDRSGNSMTTRYLGQPVVDVEILNSTRTSPMRSKTTPAFPPSDTGKYAPSQSLPLAGDTTQTQEPTTNDATGAKLHNQLMGELQTHLSRYLAYPPLARERGWEGTVLLGLRVESDGHLEKIRIERSSGYAVLDHSALNSLSRLGHLAGASLWLNGRGVDVQLPVIYRLVEN